MRCHAEVRVALPASYAPDRVPRNLIAEVHYTIAAEPGRGERALSIADSESAARSLAALAIVPRIVDRAAEAVVAPIAAPRDVAQLPRATPVAPVRPRESPAPPVRLDPKPRLVAAAREVRAAPSFRCRWDETKWQAIVCNDANLIPLDQQVSLLDSQSRANAGTPRCERLAQTRSAFLARRDQLPL